MKNTIAEATFSLLLLLTFTIFAPESCAKSIASFPVNWQDWPVVKRDKVYSADTVLPEGTSLFVQESIYSYTWMNNGAGSPLTIRVNPVKLKEYSTHGPFSDGITAIAVAETSNVIWVTEHIGGYPIYGSYDFNGIDVSETHPSLEPSFCHRCHSTYQDICVNGTCYASEEDH